MKITKKKKVMRMTLRKKMKMMRSLLQIMHHQVGNNREQILMTVNNSRITYRLN